jgi:hypothetical protein
MKKIILSAIAIVITLSFTGCDPADDYVYTSSNVEVELDTVDYYDIQRIHDNDDYAVCKLSVTTFQYWNTDAYLFNTLDIGNIVEYSTEEKWLDISTYSVYDLMDDRINKASNLGCDKLLFLNTDIYDWNNGFTITQNITEQYLTDLIYSANMLNMEVGALDLDIGDNYTVNSLFDFLKY